MRTNNSLGRAVAWRLISASMASVAMVAAMMAGISKPTVERSPPVAAVPDWESLSEPLCSREWAEEEIGLAPPPPSVGEIELLHAPEPAEFIETRYVGLERPPKNNLLNTIGTTTGAGFVSRGAKARAQMIPVGCDSQIEYPSPEAEQLDLALTRE